jgi:chromosome segregation ATPase
LSLNEKIDLQEVEINEQTIVIDELRNEIHLLNDKDLPRQSPSVSKSTNEQQYLVEELDKKLYELETERTCLVFEHERLKTNLDLCIDEKQHLIQQRAQTGNELKKLKLRILALQDQVHRLRRNNQSTNKKNANTPISSMKKRVTKKTKSKKSCLEVLLDQNSTFRDDLQDESSILYRITPSKSDRFPSSYRQRHRTCSLCDHHTETSLMKRRRRPSISSTIPKKRCQLFN